MTTRARRREAVPIDGVGLLAKRRVLLAACVLFLFAYGLAEAVVGYIWNPWIATSPASLFIYTLVRIVYALISIALIVTLAQAVRPLPAPKWAGWAVAGCGFALSVAIAGLVLDGFPNSGDEYGYNYLADTFLHHRLWNASTPHGLHDVFETFYIGDRDGKRVSQYPPGWPALLSVFKLAEIGQYASAVVGLAACAFLWLALRRLVVPNGVRVGVLTLGAASPFTLFQNASYFNHSLSVACLSAMIWLDLRDGDAPSPWNRAGIGLAFGVLLTTRYEAFLIAFLLFALDGLIRKRARFAAWATPAAVAGLPIALLFLWYNWRITGHPFQTTLAWASPNITYGLDSTGVDGSHSLIRGVGHTVWWATIWQDFASVVIVPLYVVALWRRIATRDLRWFDMLLPVMVVFFVFYPDYGGFQYGPRYWYFGYAALPVTIAAGLRSEGGLWQLGRRRLDPMRMAFVQLASFAGFTLGYATFLHFQIEGRMMPLGIAAAAPRPAVVLMPDDLPIRFLTWQKNPHHLLGRDYTRNGVEAWGPVMIGIDLGEERTALLCRQLPDRHIFKFLLDSPPPAGRLAPVCNGSE